MSTATAIRIKNICFLQFSILILSLGAMVAKKASSFSMSSLDFALWFALELIIMAVYAVLWQQIIKRFEISVAFANKGTLILWTFLWAGLFFGEKIVLKNLAGAALIIIGIVLVFEYDK